MPTAGDDDIMMTHDTNSNIDHHCVCPLVAPSACQKIYTRGAESEQKVISIPDFF